MDIGGRQSLIQSLVPIRKILLSFFAVWRQFHLRRHQIVIILLSHTFINSLVVNESFCKLEKIWYGQAASVRLKHRTSPQIHKKLNVKYQIFVLVFIAVILLLYWYCIGLLVTQIINTVNGIFVLNTLPKYHKVKVLPIYLQNNVMYLIQITSNCQTM